RPQREDGGSQHFDRRSLRTQSRSGVGSIAMPRFSALLPAVFVGLVLPGCNPDETTSDAETSAGATSTGTSTASASDPSLGTSSGTDAGSTSSAGADPSTTGAEEDASTSTADAEASSTGAAVAGDGICGLRSEADVTEDGYAGWEEYYLIGDEGLGDPLCEIGRAHV